MPAVGTYTPCARCSSARSYLVEWKRCCKSTRSDRFHRWTDEGRRRERRFSKVGTRKSGAELVSHLRTIDLFAHEHILEAWNSLSRDQYSNLIPRCQSVTFVIAF
jgi:hypothetical protein